jgi:hypothetical protein
MSQACRAAFAAVLNCESPAGALEVLFRLGEHLNNPTGGRMIARMDDSDYLGSLSKNLMAAARIGGDENWKHARGLLAEIEAKACWPDVLRDIARFQRDLGQELRVPKPLPDPEANNTILWHGDRLFSIGRHEPILLTETEDMVLRAFLGDPPHEHALPAMDKRELCRRSVEHAPRLLTALREKYDCRFARAIRTPKGKKASGGYSVRIRRAGDAP